MSPPDRAREDASLISLSCVLPLPKGQPLQQFVVQTGVRAKLLVGLTQRQNKLAALVLRAYCLSTPLARAPFSCFVVRRRRVGNYLAQLGTFHLAATTPLGGQG